MLSKAEARRLFKQTCKTRDDKIAMQHYEQWRDEVERSKKRKPQDKTILKWLETKR